MSGEQVAIEGLVRTVASMLREIDSRGVRLAKRKRKILRLEGEIADLHAAAQPGPEEQRLTNQLSAALWESARLKKECDALQGFKAERDAAQATLAKRRAEHEHTLGMLAGARLSINSATGERDKARQSLDKAEGECARLRAELAAAVEHFDEHFERRTNARNILRNALKAELKNEMRALRGDALVSLLEASDRADSGEDRRVVSAD